MLDKRFLYATCLTFIILLFVSLTEQPVKADETVGAPDASAILEMARIAPERVLFEEDFEGTKPNPLVEWYGGQVPHKVDFLGVTTEQAFSGKHAFKMQVTFEPGRHGCIYFRLPVRIPVWSDLTITMHVKAQTPPKTWFYHGAAWGNAEEGGDGNVLQGKKVADKNGWEEWKVVARKSGLVGQFLSGPAIMFTLPDHSPATTVTFYVDKITVTGKLPSSWASMWAKIYRYFTVDGEKVKRASGTRRIKAMKAWYAECEKHLKKLVLPSTTAGMVAEQHKGLMDKVERDLGEVKPMMETIDKRLMDRKTPFNADLNKPERLLMSARHYLDIAASYSAYAGKYSDTDFVTFALDITQSYAILPAGPMAHNDELSYLGWDQNKESYENPQILPDTTPVPAAPARQLTGFGCRGTYVPLSFVIRAGSELTNLTVTADDLKSAVAVIPASAVDLRVVAPWYRPFAMAPRLMNEMLLHDPAFAVPVAATKKNKYKDPKFGDDADHLLPLTVPAGTNRQFYALIKIPADASAGVYKGQITAQTANGKTIVLAVALEVLPFDLEPTPYAYSFFYRSYLRDEAFKKSQGIHSWYKTRQQMAAELKAMAEHGCNTLNLYDGAPTKAEKGWDFTELDARLSLAKGAGLTRVPFTWLGHNVPFIPDNRTEELKTWESVMAAIKERVSAANEFCRKNGYPRPAFFGHDEASGEALMQLSKGYNAVNQAGGIVTVACYPNYFSEIGTALSLPIVFGGGQTFLGQKNIQASQKAGYECWIYNCPATNMAASPSVYRRRYGLAMWKNGEQGAAPWEYCGMPQVDKGEGYEAISCEYNLYAVGYPTWSGKPIDTIIYEAWREGVYDTRYMATLQNRLAATKTTGKNPALSSEVEKWMADFSVNEDLQNVRRQMADYIIRLK